MYHKPINEYIEKICETCGTRFTVKATNQLVKRRFCSKSCSNCSSRMAGRNSGKRHTEEWKQWARKYFSGEDNPFYGKIHKKETIERFSSSLRGRHLSNAHKQKLSSRFSGEGNPFYGKLHSKETIDKIREKANSPKEKLRRREWAIEMAKKRMGARFAPLYNPDACDLFDTINIELGWNGQHAKHNGEKQVLGWFLDYYEPTQNVAIEFDEPSHNQKSKKERDERKQLEIITELGCKFFRIKENQNWKEILCEYV